MTLRTKAPPAQPTVALVQRCLREWDTQEKYTLQDKSLTLLFQRLCPANDDILHVLLKVSALNDFYSTNIYDTFSVARHIFALGANDRIRHGDLTLVNELACVKTGNKHRNFYSFASKYCGHHNPEAFPIYDSYVEKMLMHFRGDSFADFRRADLKTYARFVEIIQAFRKHYALEKFTLREIDIYLWLAGKEAFNPYAKPQSSKIS